MVCRRLGVRSVSSATHTDVESPCLIGLYRSLGFVILHKNVVKERGAHVFLYWCFRY